MDSLKIRRILVPTDLSEPAHHALVYARLFAERLHAHVDVVYADPVLPPLSFFDNPAAIINVLPAAEEEKNLEQRLREEAISTLGPTIPFAVKVVEGSAFPMIVKMAQELRSDLILIGTRGLRGWRRTFLGSLTSDILHATDRPVLTVKLIDGNQSPKLARILCPVNMTDVARESLRAARSLAADFGAELIVAHVVDTDEEKTTAGPLLRRWLEESGMGDVQWRDLVLHGGTAERVLDCIDDLGIDLLVIGAQHKVFSDETIIGTTTERLLRFANCPVLTITRREVPKARQKVPQTMAVY